MFRSPFPLITLLLVLAGCGEDPRLEPLNEGAPLPEGVEGIDDAVDGLIVGHRMMAAGEYELALKEYYRAGGDHGLTADVLSAIGSANLKLGRLGQAERQLRRAIDEDEKFAAAWNNLGVVLMEQGEIGEAARTFRVAFSLDSGQSAEIKENLKHALANIENPAYTSEQQSEFELVRRGSGQYRILSTP
ncbi:tetratricopeptide repeat protein [Tropicimonas sp. TH_r6]|uniref:tetratricopeptide repeat protein n=1 Tax=Tropicimonas sp. TH_r6 TaxID=3082085 RepID=UPI002954A056|nr:tetratricopeptide repeat protein [Tropicimonas sp. TH_r6]MDV7142229.1 tetratricopeptide repeat protein [Tropicimonas sp. TH_r6]